MRHIYNAIQLAEQLTLDEILDYFEVTHADYRTWLKKNRIPLYPMTKGMYEEIQIMGEQGQFLTRSDRNKVRYTDSWSKRKPSKEQAIIDYYKTHPDASQKQVAHDLGITQVRVSQVINKHNLVKSTRKKRKCRMPPVEEFIALKKKGLSTKQIAQKLDVSTSTVYKKLCKNI